MAESGNPSEHTGNTPRGKAQSRSCPDSRSLRMINCFSLLLLMWVKRYGKEHWTEDIYLETYANSIGVWQKTKATLGIFSSETFYCKYYSFRCGAQRIQSWLTCNSWVMCTLLQNIGLLAHCPTWKNSQKHGSVLQAVPWILMTSAFCGKSVYISAISNKLWTMQILQCPYFRRAASPTVSHTSIYEGHFTTWKWIGLKKCNVWRKLAKY
jgi:hypothetical protein